MPRAIAVEAGRPALMMEERVTQPPETTTTEVRSAAASAERRTGGADTGRRRGPIALIIVMFSIELLWIAAIAFVLYRVL